MLEEDEKVFYRLLKKWQDDDGIIRCTPEEIEKELDMLSSYIESLLEGLCEKGVLVYVTRINKSTGEVLKVIQLI